MFTQIIEEMKQKIIDAGQYDGRVAVLVKLALDGEAKAYATLQKICGQL